jgi:hypothetical protein
LADGEELTLPDSVHTMIRTRVLETEKLTRKAGETKADDAGNAPPPPQSPPPPPQSPPPPPPRAAAARHPNRPVPSSQGTMAAIGLVALVLLFIAIGTYKSGQSSSSNSSSSSSTSSRASSSTSDDDDDYSTPTRTRTTPTVDRTHEAFEDISKGDCLDAYKDPYDYSEWSVNVPTVVDCDRPGAYVEVTGVGDSSGDCHTEEWYEGTTWRSSSGGETIVLCIDRNLRVGECILGLKSETPGKIAMTRHGLLTSWGCGKSTVPRDFDYILQVTAITSGDCPSGSRSWDYLDGRDLCLRVV